MLLHSMLIGLTVCAFLLFDQRNNQGKRRMNSRTSLAQREDRIRRTVYVSDIDQQVQKSYSLLFSFSLPCM